MARRKQKTVVATLHHCPRPVSQGEPWSAADDGAGDMEQLAEAASGDAGRNYLSKRSKMGLPPNRDTRAMDKRHRARVPSPRVFPHWLATATRASSTSALLRFILVLTCRITKVLEPLWDPRHRRF